MVYSSTKNFGELRYRAHGELGPTHPQAVDFVGTVDIPIIAGGIFCVKAASSIQSRPTSYSIL